MFLSITHKLCITYYETIYDNYLRVAVIGVKSTNKGHLNLNGFTINFILPGNCRMVQYL